MSDKQVDSPTPSAMRRALRRARDGVALDATEAGVLLQATGQDLIDLCASAARVRDAGLHVRRPARGGHLLPEGVHPADPVVPGPLPLLHLRHRARPVAGRVPVPGRGPGDRPAGRRARAARRRCSPSATGRRTAGRRLGSGWTAHGYDSTLAYVRAMAIRVLEETGLLPHLNPGVMSWQELQRLKPVAPSMGMMLETTSTAIYTEPSARISVRRTRTRRFGCGCWRTPAAARSLSPLAFSSASARRSPTARSRCSRSGGSRGSTAPSRR